MMKKKIPLLLFVVLSLSALLFGTSHRAGAESGFFTNNCQGCHSVSTCDGCHAHGTHPTSAKSSLNITAATDKTSYQPGETVSVTIDGGYRNGWVRAILYNGDPASGGSEVARSSGPSGLGGGASFPIILTTKAPATPGTYTYSASWYGNQYDKSGAFFGARWRPDPNNPNHGEEIVNTNSFTVVSATPPPAPAISVTDSVAPSTDLAVPFGSVTSGSSATQTVTVKNTGNANLLVGAVGSANPLAAPFSVKTDSCSNQTIAPAASCTVAVAFSPTTTGAFADSFSIPSNDPANGSVTVNLSGTGAAMPVPAISVTDSVSPTTDLSVPFGSVNAGSTASQTVTVKNTGTANLVIGTVGTLGAPFSIKTDSCSSQTIAPAASCTITVAFAPVTTGTFTDSFSIPSNDPAKSTVTVNVSGDGAAVPVPAISVTDSVTPNNDLLVPFGSVNAQTSVTQTVTVRNTGTANLMIGALGSGDPLAAPFSVTTDACSNKTIAPAASCSVTVAFAPATTGSFTDSFNIPSNDPANASVTVNMTGTGAAVPVPDIAVTDSVAPNTDLQADFGSILAGTSKEETVTITNGGNASLFLGSVGSGNGLASPFSITSDACSGKTLGLAASCTLTVKFAPTAAVSSTDSFSIPSNDPDEPSVVFSVRGQGLSVPVADVSVTDSAAPATDLKVAFGTVAAGSSSAQTVTVTNTGNADLVLGTIASADPVQAPFAITTDTCSGRTLLPTENCTLTVEFGSVSAGTFADSFDIPSNDPDESTLTVSLDGVSAASTSVGEIRIKGPVKPGNDLRLSFKEVRGGRTVDKTITVVNTAAGPLMIGTIGGTNALAAPFSIAADQCSDKTLGKDETCAVTVRFSAPENCTIPADAESDDDDRAGETRCTYNDSFDIPSNDPDEQIIMVQVSGASIPSKSNLRPRKSHLKYPAHKQEKLDRTVELRWEKCSDPEGDDVRYEVRLSKRPDFATAVPLAQDRSSAASGGMGTYAGTGLGFLFFGVAFMGTARGRKGMMVIALMLMLAGTTFVACSSSTRTGQQTEADVSQQVSGLESGTTYYWKVVATDSQGSVTDSDVSSFTTK
jgi:hypothetical protein